MQPQPDFDLADLRRAPDVEGPDLLAADAADRLILDEAAPAMPGEPSQVAVLGDRYGALALGAAAAGAPGARSWVDSRAGQLAAVANAERSGLSVQLHSDLGPEVLAGARLVLMRLPRSLEELAERAAAVAALADPAVQVFAGGRVKHMHRSMNGVLGRYFTQVRPSLGRQKSRVLVCSGSRGTEWSPALLTERHEDLRLTVCARAGVFVGTGVDAGTRLLLGALQHSAPPQGTALDLGCGSGVLATMLALDRPDLRVLATDDSALAADSARATAAANSVQVTVSHDDAASQIPGARVDLVVLNPPFHSGAEVHTHLAHKLFAAAARVLRPGGQLWAVWNSHLRYRSALSSVVGPTRQITRDPRFTVTASVRR